MIELLCLINWISCFQVIFETFLYINLFVHILLYTSATENLVLSGRYYKFSKFFPKFSSKDFFLFTRVDILN